MGHQTLASSLYIHFPFCEKKCHYCDFYSVSSETGPFIEALKTEIALCADRIRRPLDTLFIGGGTPSLFSAHEFQEAVRPLIHGGYLSPQTEWTLEANPNSLTPEKLRLYRSIGVNRLSLGIQSLDPDLLRWLGRIHTREGALKALENAFQAGFENVSADLICGIPGQATSTLEMNLKELLRYPIKHLSCYLLTLHEGHPLEGSLPPDSQQLDQLVRVHEIMEEAGFRHYEISNYARSGFEARHNLTYWRGADYIGLGPSAHSFDSTSHRRWKNVSSLEDYCERLKSGQSPMEWEEILTAQQLEIEKWMLALRLDEGFPKTWIHTPRLEQSLAKLLDNGLLEPHPAQRDRFRATMRGFFLADSLVRELV